MRVVVLALAWMVLCGLPAPGDTDASRGAAAKQGGGAYALFRGAPLPPTWSAAPVSAAPATPAAASGSSGASPAGARDADAVPSADPAASGAGGGPGLPVPMFVTVTVNGKPIADFLQVARVRDNTFFVPAECFRAARLSLPTSPPLNLGGKLFYPLDGIPGLQYRFNDAEQVLDVTVPSSQFELSRINAQLRQAYPPTSPSPGFVLNHDVQVFGAGGRVQGSGLFEAVGFGFGGVVTNSVLAGDLSSGRSIRRLDTQFMREFPDRMRVLTVGDALTSGGAWNRQLHFLGARWGSNFSIQPSFVPFALPGLQGQAAEPSTLDLYVNNVRTVSRPVNAGPFTIDNIPTITSQGNIQMVLTDALGRQQVVTTAYIAAPQLLRKGVHDFGYEAGVLRWGIASPADNYHTGFAAGSHRFGLSDRFTLGMEGELAGVSQAMGVSGTWGLLPLGLLSTGAAVSHSDHGAGGLLHAELAHREPKLGLGGGVQFATRPFRQLGLGEAEGTPRLQAQAQVSYAFASSITAGLAYVVRQNYWTPLTPGTAFRALSGSLSVKVGRLGYLSWTMNYSPTSTPRTTGFAVFTIPLGQRRSMSLSGRHGGANPSATVSMMQSPPIGDGFGYRSRISSDRALVEGGLDYQNRVGAYTVEAGRDNAGTSFRLEEKSGYAWVQNRLIPTRWLYDSFALVEVPDTKGVRVYANNQYITKTNGRGLAVVPMVAYDANAVRLDDRGIPVEVNMDLEERTVVPMTRTGVLVQFKAAPNRGVIIVLQLPDGKPVPAGAEARVEGADLAATVGFDGEVYLEKIDSPAVLNVQAAEFACRANVPAIAYERPLPRVGPVTCTTK